MSELRKLRRVLDFVPAAEMKSWKDKEYYEALNRRLHREILVERPLARPARDEAVRVVDPAEWEAARAARERQLLQEAELEHARNELERVLAREDELRREVDAMRGQLGPLRAEAEEKRKVALQLVGVRRGGAPAAPATPPPEPEPSVGWEPVEEAAPAPHATREKELTAAGWEIVAPEEATPSAGGVWQDASSAKPDVTELEREAQMAEEAIRRVEAEIQKVESELRTLANQETDLRTRAEPFKFKGYTLYRRTVGRGAAARELHFFSRERPASGVAAPLPEGHEVALRSNGLPYLKKAAAKKADRPRAAGGKARKGR